MTNYGRMPVKAEKEPIAYVILYESYNTSQATGAIYWLLVTD
jgi:hypothetical protein